MKKTGLWLLAAVISLTLCTGFGFLLATFTRPMEDLSYDLSLYGGEDGEEGADGIEDEKGWTVFTQEGDSVQVLTPKGFGYYTSLAYPGQTFYFSRTMTEKLSSPTLTLGTANQSVAVFLDDELLYTDFPDLTLSIGSFNLPMLDWDRTELLTLSLPSDYLGKTLTIAQSTPEIADKPGAELDAFPCGVTFSCGYAYESGIISESFQTALPAFLCFATALFLLIAFLRKLWQERLDPALLLLALTAFLWMTWRLSTAAFASHYIGSILSNYLPGLCRMFSLSLLMAFLASRMTGLRSAILWPLSGIHFLSVVGECYIELAMPMASSNLLSFLRDSLPQLLALLGLVTALVCGFWEMRRKNQFYRLFELPALLIVSAYVLHGFLSGFFAPDYALFLLQQLQGAIQFALPGYFLWKLATLMLILSFFAAITDFLIQESARRTELHLLEERNALAQTSFDSLRRQNEQVMMLRHDMTKHLSLLHRLLENQGESEQLTSVRTYLEELIGQQEKIRSVIQSGNEKIDIILNGKLSVLLDADIPVEIVRTNAPKNLPLSDAELCSLIMNIADNAVAASLSPRTEVPYVKLDLHLKNNYFVFICENGCPRSPENFSKTGRTDVKEEAALLKEHGLGLKIIRQICERYGNLLKLEQEASFYRVTLAIPFPADK